MFEHKDNTLIISNGDDTADRRCLKQMLMEIMVKGASFVVTDIDGKLYVSLRDLLTRDGYKVKRLDMKDPQKSSCYDPLKYICSSSDVQKIADTIIESTDPAESRHKDTFFEHSERMLLHALLAYVADHAETKNRTLSYLADMAACTGSAEEESGHYDWTYFDQLFDQVKEKESYAFKCYQNFRSDMSGPERKKQLDGVKVSLVSRLNTLFDDRIRAVTSHDEMELDTLGNQKTAVFVSSSMGSVALLPALLYTQALCMICDNGPHPIPVHMIMDMRENKNPGYLPEFISHICCSKDLFSFSVIIESVKDIENNMYRGVTEEVLSACDNICILSGLTTVRFSGCRAVIDLIG